VTDQMLEADAIVVGGGIVGGAAALFLRKRGLQVILFERDRVGMRASGVNFGGVRQQGRDLREIPLSHLARRIWADLPQHVGIDGERMFTGHLRLARSEADMALLERYRQDAGALGLSLELMGRNALAARFPWAGPRVIGGSLCASDGHANPRLVGPAFALAARAAGARVQEQSEILTVEAHGQGFEVTLADGCRAAAPILVNAAGAWAGQLAAQLGEPVAVEPKIPQVLVTEPAPYGILPVLGVVGGDLYLRQIPRGNVIFGSADRPAGPDFLRSRPTAEDNIHAARVALSILPGLKSLAIIRSWTGVDGYVGDGSPVIGHSRRHAGLFHAFGFCGHGFQLGPAAGWVIAELATGAAPSAPLTGLGIERYVKAPAAR
jgi:sarcosine oxidase subunit beta